MDHSELIEKLGGVNAVARRMVLKPPSVSAWKRQGIPEDKLVRLAVMAEDEGITSRKELFPTDFAKIWPELADQSDTTAGTHHE